MRVDVIVRCRNEMPWTERTLLGLTAQEGVHPRILFIDCDSTDGSREAAESMGVRLIDWDPNAYVPGRVLNRGMEEAQSEITAFVNADAVPLSTGALAALVEPFDDPDVAATFARQVARPDADQITRLDYERAFGDEVVPTRLGPFFSMAASAIRRAVWAELPFDPNLRYSEDVDWTTRVAALGYRIVYVPDARFEHSHAYDLRGHFRRRSGEGEADTSIHRLGRASLATDFARPLVGSLLRDARARAARPNVVATRVVQAAGYFVGRWRSTR
jgi:rhamnosyltransferase